MEEKPLDNVPTDYFEERRRKDEPWIRLIVFLVFAFLMVVSHTLGPKWALAIMAPFVLYQFWSRIFKGYWIE